MVDAVLTVEQLVPLNEAPQSNPTIAYFKTLGNRCYDCGVEFTHAAFRRHPNHHKETCWQVVTEDLERKLTRGHIIPLGVGGKDSEYNIRPLCHLCNDREGSSCFHLIYKPLLFEAVVKGYKVAVLKPNPSIPDINTLRYRTVHGIFLCIKLKEVILTFVEGGSAPIKDVRFCTAPAFVKKRTIGFFYDLNTGEYLYPGYDI
jgi:hypothetical protein